LLIVGEIRLLVWLSRTFGVPVAITEAVEVEIRKSRKFRSRFTKDFDKALETGAIRIIDVATLSHLVSTDPNAVYDSIQTAGSRLEHSGLDYGEAYTFAAGIVLNAPVVSNDASAIRTAKKKALQLPTLIARVFDILVLCHQCNYLSAKDCDGIRKTLVSEKEFVPVAFLHASFQDGLASFFARIVNAEVSVLGSTSAAGVLDVRLVLTRLSTTVEMAASTERKEEPPSV
jgi:hypothetical protein